MPEDSAKFSLKFGAEENDINAATYGIILINTVTLLEEANKELGTNAHLEIKVKSERKGSYLVDLAIQSAAAIATFAPLINKENIKIVGSVASKVVSTATEGYELWKKLKGEKPKEITEGADTVIIVTGDNNTIEVDKSVSNLVLSNKRGQEALANTFSALAADQEVDDFSVLDENKEALFLAEKKDFPRLTRKVEIVQPEKQTFTETTHLHITARVLRKIKRVTFSIKDFKFPPGYRIKLSGITLIAESPLQKEIFFLLNWKSNKNLTRL